MSALTGAGIGVNTHILVNERLAVVVVIVVYQTDFPFVDGSVVESISELHSHINIVTFAFYREWLTLVMPRGVFHRSPVVVGSTATAVSISSAVVVAITVTNNTVGGQPVSMQNIRET